MDEIEKSLMSYEEYGEKTIIPGGAYVYEIEREGQILDYFGVAHIYSLDDEQVPQLRSKFNEFANKTNGQERIVLTEGGKRPVAASEQEAMKVGGEPNLITFWATNEGIEAQSPEPDRLIEANHLLEQFSREEVMHYYFARQINQWNLMKRPEGLEEYMEHVLKRHSSFLNWEDFDFSLDNMVRIHEETTGQKFNPDDWELFQKLSDPRKNIAVTNKVCMESSRFRDAHIVSEIIRLWKEGKDIFILYGRTHAIMQEPAIRKLIQ